MSGIKKSAPEQIHEPQEIKEHQHRSKNHHRDRSKQGQVNGGPAQISRQRLRFVHP